MYSSSILGFYWISMFFKFIPSQLRIQKKTVASVIICWIRKNKNNMKVPSTLSLIIDHLDPSPRILSANTQEKMGTCRLMGCDRPRYFVIPVLFNIPQNGCKATGAVDLLAAFRWPRRAVASTRCRAIGLFEGVAWWVTKRCDVPKTMKSFLFNGKTSLNQWIELIWMISIVGWRYKPITPPYQCFPGDHHDSNGMCSCQNSLFHRKAHQHILI